MALELDARQRAMLREMGVPVWLPESGVAVLERSAPAASATNATPAPRAAAPGAPHTPLARVPAASPPPAMADAPAVAPARPALPIRSPQAAGAAAHQGAPGGGDGQTADWEVLAQQVQACQDCERCASRHQAVLLPPALAVPCDWLVLGDPPDEEEDRAGLPFAGQAGVLLDNMLRALGLQRANPDPAAVRAAGADPATRVYVSQVLKCRPAHGAVPQAAELARCERHLQQEIALVRPRMILSLGRFANQLLLAADPALAALPPGKLRGTVHRYQGIPVVVSFAPKLLMRNGADKARAWADLCLAAAALEG